MTQFPMTNECRMTNAVSMVVPAKRQTSRAFTIGHWRLVILWALDIEH